MFDVTAGGEILIQGLDLSVDPGAFHAAERVVDALVMDGVLDLMFGGSGHAGLVSAIEAYPLGLSDLTPPVIADIPEPQGFVYGNPPQVSISAFDPADGELASIQFSIDGEPWKSVESRIGEPKRDFVWTMPHGVLQALASGSHSMRLRAVDLAGRTAQSAPWTFARSAIVAVEGPALGSPGLRVWPNPARSATVRVAFAQPLAGVAHLRLLDVAGRTVLSRSLGWRPAGGSETVLDLDALSLPAGLYFVRYQAPGADHTERIIRLP